MSNQDAKLVAVAFVKPPDILLTVVKLADSIVKNPVMSALAGIVRGKLILELVATAVNVLPVMLDMPYEYPVVAPLIVKVQPVTGAEKTAL